MDAFDDMTDEFHKILANARRKSNNGLTADAIRILGGCDRVMQRMESEARAQDSQTKRAMKGVVGKCKDELRMLKKECGKASASKDRASLFTEGATSSSVSNKGGFNSKARGEAQRQRALDGVKQLDETDALLQNSRRLVEESHELGTATMVRIDEQTEILMRTKETVDQTHGMTKSAGRILKTMTQRYCLNKCFLYTIILVLVVANVLCIYFYNAPKAKEKK